MIVKCESCEAIVDADELNSYIVYDKEGPSARYTFSQCPKCSSPFLTVQEEIDYEVWDEPTRIYPPKDKSAAPSLPQSVRNSYQEALSCYRAKAYSATVIMCRKTLEAICSEHNVHQSNLVKSLKSMKENGIIENRLYEWAEALRIAGNEAAHEVNANIPRQDAKDILEFTEALLEYVYTFRDKFNEFKKRRGAAAQTKKQTK